jgi:hypothetical protein
MRANSAPLARTAGGDLTKSRIYKDMAMAALLCT